MPCFYFHLRYGTRLSRDNEGLECPNLSAAKQDAEIAARDMLVEAIKHHHHERVPDAFEIVDDAGRTLHTLPFAAILPEPFKK
jgi:hypothetical protein